MVGDLPMLEDHPVKLEADAFIISGGEATMTIYIPLPCEHPMHSLLGQVAAKWALVEHFLDQAIWRLAKLDNKAGACVTGQILGSIGKTAAIYALCKHRKLDVEIIDQLKILSRKLQASQNRCNRILHDARYIQDDGAETKQFKNMARDEFEFGFHSVSEEFIKETLETIETRFIETGQFVSTIFSMAL
jgi:hypothetical protein